MRKRIFQSLFFAIGIIVLIYLIRQMGWAALWEQLQQLGWWWIPILCLGLTWQICHTLAWHQILHFFEYRIRFQKLFSLKMIAEAINMVLPSANLGGDTLRAHLIRKEVPMSGGVTSVVVDKTLDYITKMIFNIVGFGVAVFFIDIPPAWFWGCLSYLVFTLIFNGLLVWVQVKGFSGSLFRLIRHIPPLYKALQKKQQQFESLDEHLNSVYVQGRAQLYLSGLWHTLGRLLGVAEIWLILWLLQSPASIVDVFFVAAVVNVVNGIFFIIPGQLGVSEGAQIMLVKLLGFSAAIGLSLGVIRRIRRLALTAVGLILLAIYRQSEEINETLEQEVKT